jgi:hypothetical protein
MVTEAASDFPRLNRASVPSWLLKGLLCENRQIVREQLLFAGDFQRGFLPRRDFRGAGKASQLHFPDLARILRMTIIGKVRGP